MPGYAAIIACEENATMLLLQAVLLGINRIADEGMLLEINRIAYEGTLLEIIRIACKENAAMLHKLPQDMLQEMVFEITRIASAGNYTHVSHWHSSCMCKICCFPIELQLTCNSVAAAPTCNAARHDARIGAGKLYEMLQELIQEMLQCYTNCCRKCCRECCTNYT